MRGSRASRRLSPRKLKAITTVRIARPGNIAIHQRSNVRAPSATIAPHSGEGGLAPRPRKLSPASKRMALPSSSVASTSTGPYTFGMISTASARRFEDPSRPRCRHELASAECDDEAAHDAGVRRPGDDDDGEHGVAQPGPERGDHRHRQDDRREGEDEIADAHDRAVEQAGEVAGDRAEDGADRHRDDHEQQGEGDRHPGAEDHPAEHVAAETVGAEPVRRARRLEAWSVLGQRIGGGDQVAEDDQQQPGAGDRQARRSSAGGAAPAGGGAAGSAGDRSPRPRRASGRDEPRSRRAHPRIDHAVEHVDDEVERDVHGGDEQADAHHRRQVERGGAEVGVACRSRARRRSARRARCRRAGRRTSRRSP